MGNLIKRRKDTKLSRRLGVDALGASPISCAPSAVAQSQSLGGVSVTSDTAEYLKIKSFGFIFLEINHISYPKSSQVSKLAHKFETKLEKNFTGRNMSFIAVGMGAGVVAGHWSMTTGSSMGGSGGGTTLGRNRSRKSSSSFSISSSLAPVKSIVYKMRENFI